MRLKWVAVLTALWILGGCGNRITDEKTPQEETNELNSLETNEQEQGSGAVSDDLENEEVEEDIAFYHQALSDDLISTLESISPIDESVISYRELRHVIVSHYDFNDEVQTGELIVNARVADEIVEIFKEIFEVKYPIEKMVLISEYNNDDDLSMVDNNTSAFNFRPITGGGGWSNHAYGLAIDINPKLNPYVTASAVYPSNAHPYVDRNKQVRGMIKKGDALFNAFTSRGWSWGGDWTVLKDYQHFEKEL